MTATKLTQPLKYHGGKGRQCVLIEREERYCEAGANRLCQKVLF